MENLTIGRERRQRAGSDLLLNSYKSDNDNLLDFLAPCPSVKSQLDLIVTGLRRRQLCGGYNCAKTTVELIRSIIGQCKFTSTFNMMNAVRIIGRTLMTSAPSEMTIGNIVRRVLFMIREEYSSQIRILEASQINLQNNLTSPTGQSISPVVENAFQMTKVRRIRTDSEVSASSNQSNESIEININEKNIPILNLAIPNLEISDSLKSLKVSSPTKRSDSYSSFSAADLIDPTLQQSLGRVLSQGSLDLKSTKLSNQTDSSEYSKSFPLMRQNVIAAINELNDEMDNVYGPICEQATEHIHADEVILTYGNSLTVELFLKSAARKRKFQVIIAEDGTSLDGHKLAVSLSKIANISITLIPDSGIYAIMCRVNKVLININ
jgi:translation initiation factor eIF-2B subunit beta